MKTGFFTSKRFVILMACLSGVAAMGIDSVLPTFSAIIEAFAIPSEQHNRVHQVVFVFMLGFASLQILFGILADALGRKPVLIMGLLLCVLSCLAVYFVNSFEQLLWARFFQGAGLAAPRVLTMTIVRDRMSGAAMSRIMSYVTMVFLMIPVVAPMLGQLVVVFFSWRSVFLLLMLFALSLLFWVWWELPETLSPANRQPISFNKLKKAGKAFIGSKETQVYLLMISLLFGMLMAYIGLAEPILQKGVYHLGTLFPLYFALVVMGMLAAALINARFVMRWGMQKMIVIAMVLLLISDVVMFLSVILNNGVIPLGLFITLLITHFLGFGLAMPNLNALCIQPFHQIAGTASALIGTITTVLGVLLAQLISYFYNDTLYSMGIGYIACTGLLWIAFLYLKRNKIKT